MHFDIETVTPKKTPYPDTAPEGFIVLTIVRRSYEKKARFKISNIDLYVEDTADKPYSESGIAPLGSYVVMGSGKAWSVKETPEQIDVLIDKFSIPPIFNIGPR